MAVDFFLGHIRLEDALPRLPSGVSCYVAPPITVDKSNPEHALNPNETLCGLGLALAPAQGVGLSDNAPRS